MVDSDLQGAKVATTSLCMGSRKEGVTVGKKMAGWRSGFNVYSSPSVETPPPPLVSLRLKKDKPTFTDENWSDRYSAASFRPAKVPAPRGIL